MEGKERGGREDGRNEYVFEVVGRVDNASFTHWLMAGTEENTRMIDRWLKLGGILDVLFLRLSLHCPKHGTSVCFLQSHREQVGKLDPGFPRFPACLSPCAPHTR